MGKGNNFLGVARFSKQGKGIQYPMLRWDPIPRCSLKQMWNRSSYQAQLMQDTHLQVQDNFMALGDDFVIHFISKN